MINSSVRGVANHHRHKKGLRDPCCVRGSKSLRDLCFVGGSNEPCLTLFSEVTFVACATLSNQLIGHTTLHSHLQMFLAIILSVKANLTR